MSTSTSTAVELRGVSKRYRIGGLSPVSGSLRESLAATVRRLAGRAPGARSREIWSLRDVDLDIPSGDAFGLVGANGAGKSTLLRIVARITEPTEGLSRTRGRVGCLLEVGTGFHPELTGRENVFLNGALLGMGRRAIRSRFEEIVAFAGVEEFVDTPVKRYSSGMHLRLGFSVAAHLDAEILAVDEVLAVGDAQFQQRCIAKLGRIAGEGRTILFVSHDLEAVRAVCRNAAWISGGRIAHLGPAGEVTARYAAAATGRPSEVSLPMRPGVSGQIVGARLTGADGRGRATFTAADHIRIEIAFVLNEPVPGLDATIVLTTDRGVRVLDEAWSDVALERGAAAGEYLAAVTVPPILGTGGYTVGAWLGTAVHDVDVRDDLLGFQVDASATGGQARLLRLGLPWDVRRRDGPQTPG